MKLLSSILFGAAVVFGERISLQGASQNSASWTKGVAASQQDTVSLHVMLRHNKDDVARLEAALLKVSDPKSPLYGQHLSLKEVSAMTPVPVARRKAVKDFFKDAVSYDVTDGEDIAKVVLSVEEAERLFKTKFHTYTHSNGASLIRASDYSLPDDVAEAVYVVGDLVELPRVKTNPVKEAQVTGPGKWPNGCPDLSGCKGLVTPAVLAERYQLDDRGMNATNNSMTVAEFQGQYFKHTDIQKFGDACGVNVTVDNVIGGNKEKAGVESELDIEYIRGVAPGIPLTVLYSQQFSLLNWMSQINGREGAAPIQSVSYGNDEAQQTSDAYMFSCNVQFMKAGARGISVLFASGDQGVCGREGCGRRFNPDFPAGSPYITAVGGTDFVTYDIGDESAWEDGGGGFSDTFDIPSWQAEAVAAYKASPDADLPPQSYWNNTGRGYPDVSALGGQKTSYCVVANGRAEGVAGTSASCPVVAGVFARLNGLRLDAGKPVLGFLNPFIYQNPDAFNDVQAGTNTGGGKEGFKAIKGWDAATGFGTPNFQVLATRV